MAIDTATIDAAIRKAVADPYTGLPRAIILAANRDEEIYRGFGGWAQLPQDPAKLEAEGVLIAADSIYELYSSTKCVATVAMLQLLEQGKLSLDDDASQYVPELKTVKIFKGFDDQGDLVLEDNTAVVTIRQLATHTAGAFLPFPTARTVLADSFLSRRLRLLLLRPAHPQGRRQARRADHPLHGGRHSGASLLALTSHARRTAR